MLEVKNTPVLCELEQVGLIKLDLNGIGPQKSIITLQESFNRFKDKDIGVEDFEVSFHPIKFFQDSSLGLHISFSENFFKLNLEQKQTIYDFLNKLRLEYSNNISLNISVPLGQSLPLSFR